MALGETKYMKSKRIIYYIKKIRENMILKKYFSQQKKSSLCQLNDAENVLRVWGGCVFTDSQQSPERPTEGASNNANTYCIRHIARPYKSIMTWPVLCKSTQWHIYSLYILLLLSPVDSTLTNRRGSVYPLLPPLPALQHAHLSAIIMQGQYLKKDWTHCERKCKQLHV